MLNQNEFPRKRTRREANSGVHIQPSVIATTPPPQAPVAAAAASDATATGGVGFKAKLHKQHLELLEHDQMVVAKV